MNAWIWSESRNRELESSLVCSARNSTLGCWQIKLVPFFSDHVLSQIFVGTCAPAPTMILTDDASSTWPKNKVVSQCHCHRKEEVQNIIFSKPGNKISTNLKKSKVQKLKSFFEQTFSKVKKIPKLNRNMFFERDGSNM